MNIVYKSNSRKQLIPIESYLLSENRIYFIEGDITQDSAIQTCKEQLYLIMSDSEKGIDIVINSPGGEVSAGLMILDTIISSPVEKSLQMTNYKNYIPKRKIITVTFMIPIWNYRSR